MLAAFIFDNYLNDAELLEILDYFCQINYY